MNIVKRTWKKASGSVRASWKTASHRWQNAMPKFFRYICWAGTLISGTAVAVNTAMTAAGAAPHDWWSNVYPYLVGVPAGAAFVAKFTQTYNGKPIDYDEQRRAERKGKTILDRDIDTLDES